MAKYAFILIFCFTFQSAFTQDSLCVFKVNGSVLKTSANAIQVVKKGDYIIRSDKFVLDNASNILSIDKLGNAYVLNQKGNYSFKDFISNKESKSSSGLTSKYFKLIWKELRNANGNATLIGGVFRGEQLMIFPRDTVKIASSKIAFGWKRADEDSKYYVFIRDIENDKTAKFELNTNELTLYKANPIFSNGTFFEWVVTTDEFPNLDNLTFFSFELINKSEYKSLIKDYSAFQQELKALGFSSEDIKNAICEAYGICN
ncbi:MAG: hypothetical protein ED556_04635 [Winogradskyella sp.]|uniref:hypothetical protein n=1 Tax=Winogradskyella sp. TaxID=1883156 RepID=UPI000F40CA8B|nr:hypothetical protein [Winogradskyella sp.]RNC86710.1 MAG: hypothetical protein ED556_04635 [Winogradskyella sp.]